MTEKREGNVRFSELPTALDAAASAPCVGRAVALADFDSDGDMDAVLVALGEAPRLLDNALEHRGDSVTLRLVDATSKNREGIGAEVVWTGRGTSGRAVVRRSHSFMASSEPALVIAVPKGGTELRCDLTWADGGRESFEIAAGTRRTVLVRGKGNPK
jgi:hypothetical protein